MRRLFVALLCLAAAFGAAAQSTVTINPVITGSIGVTAPLGAIGGGTGVATTAAAALQSFSLVITNASGTMQHWFAADGSGAASNMVAKISGATTTPTNTPTGADGSTAMAGGGKIGSAAARDFYLDTAAQVAADSLFVCSITFNTTGTALTVLPAKISLNINGVTRVRQRLRFSVQTTGAAFDLNTTSITDGNFVFVNCLGFLN